MWPLAWDSSKTIAHIMAIIAEEELGYNVSVGPGGVYSFTAVNALAGCPDPEDTDGCLRALPSGLPSPWHLSFETWGNAEPVYERWRSAGQSAAPSRIGHMGYIGSEGHFIRPESLASGLRDDLALDWFRTFNTSRGEPARYFDPALSLRSESFAPCLRGMPSAFLETYSAHFHHGVAEENGTYTPLCPENGIWWLSPACRGNLGSCLPYVADPGNYGTDTIMQQAVHWNMPIAIATAATGDVFREIVRNHSVMTFTWMPDSQFTGLDLREVMFPRYSSAQWKRGLKITSMESATLSKWAASGLDRAAPDAHAVASSLSFSLEAVLGMLDDLARGLTHREAACRWLTAHPGDWRRWLPDPLACHAGQGLVDARGRVLEGPGGAVRCEWCPPGRLSAALAGGSRVCRRCGAGEFLDRPGQAECERCPAGSFASGQGQTFCADCPVGRFAAGLGNSDCAPCTRAHETTPFRAARSRWECACEEGHYRGSGHSEAGGRHGDCGPCPGGMRCAGGEGEPALLAGFWAGAGDSAARAYSVYRCRDSLQCPGGPAGTCAEGREGVACSACRAQHAAAEGGRCERCGGAEALPIVLACLAVLAFLVVLVVFAQQDAMKARLSTVSMCICLGQMVTVMQTLSVLGVLKVYWMEPFASILRVGSVMNFDVSLVLNACMLPDGEVVSKFALTLLIFPICVSALGAVFLCARALGRGVSLDHAFNSVGLLCLLVFLPLTMVSMEPFYCGSSPNGLASMRSDPSVVCYEGERWPWLAALGAIALLGYSVGFFSWVAWISHRYRHLVATRHGSVIMNRYRFMFQRFTVECYFFTPICLGRSLFITLVPLIFPDHGHRQVIALGLILCSFGFLHCRLQPWRGYMPNILDIVTTVCLVMLMLCAAMLMETDRQVMRGDLRVFLVGVAATALVAMLVILAALLLRRLHPHRGFAAFLCHHKGGCAVGARLMKLGLEKHLGAPVFLDSDALEDLEELLEIVRSSVQCLVVLLTAQTLSRPWCAGEIATAFSNGIPLVPVRYDDYVELTEADLDEARIGGRWPAEAFAGCEVQGVSLASVRVAYTHLRGLQKVPCLRVACCIEGDADASARAIQVVAKRCLGRPPGQICEAVVPARRTMQVLGRSHVDLAIIASNTDPEAISAAAVLSLMVRTLKQWTTLELYSPMDVNSLEKSAGPELVAVLLTNGALTACGFAETLLMAWEKWGEQMNIVVVSMERFVFPGTEAVSASIVPQVSGALCRGEAEVAAIYGKVLSQIAKPFSPSCKSSVLEVEVAEIVRRSKAPARQESLARKPVALDALPKHEPKADAPAEGRVFPAQALSHASPQADTPAEGEMEYFSF